MDTTLDKSPNAAWSVAMDDLMAAKTELAAFDYLFWDRRHHEARAQNSHPRHHGRIEDETTRLLDAKYAAEDALFATPAPDISCAIWKLQYTRQRADELEEIPEYLWNSAMSDIVRLTSGMASAF